MNLAIDPSERFAIPFVKALILAPARDRFLLQRRAKPGDPYEGFWELPGGKMRLGETAEAALRREAMEETGIRIVEVLGQGGAAHTDAFGRSARILRPLATAEIASGPWPFLGHYFACLADGDPVRTVEGEAHRWITPEAFRREFLDPGATGRCTTLDWVAMRTILKENRLADFLRVDSGGGRPG